MKHKFRIEIETGNAAFEENGMFAEISRILGEVSDSMASGFTPEKLKDLNGNTCGSVEFVEVE
jgi:hypothetical protein